MSKDYCTELALSSWGSPPGIRAYDGLSWGPPRKFLLMTPLGMIMLLPVAVPICTQLASRAVVTPASVHEILEMRRAIAVTYRALLTIFGRSSRGACHGRIPGTQD